MYTTNTYYFINKTLLATLFLYLSIKRVKPEESMHHFTDADIQMLCRKYGFGSSHQHSQQNNNNDDIGVHIQSPPDTHQQHQPIIPPPESHTVVPEEPQQPVIIKEEPDYDQMKVIVPEEKPKESPSYNMGGTKLSAKYCPSGDKTLFIVGQDMGTVQDFLNQVLPNPSGTTSYTNIGSEGATLGGLFSATDYGAGTINTSAQMELVPGSLMALGLYLVNALQDVASGRSVCLSITS